MIATFQPSKLQSTLYASMQLHAWKIHTLPVAPQQASLASSSTMLLSFALSSSARNLAAEVPVIPLPTITISASAGSSSVVRCPMRNSFGSLCQKELVEAGVGSVARSCLMVIEGGIVG